MTTHEIYLKGYQAICKDARKTLWLGTAGSYGNEQLHLTLGSEWEGLSVTATFTAGGKSTEMAMDPDEYTVEVPQEATGPLGADAPRQVVFAGSEDGALRISCGLPYYCTPTGPAAGENTAGPSPSLVEQLLSQTAAARAAADSAAESADTAATSATAAQAAAESAAENAEAAAEDSAAAVSTANAAVTTAEAAESTAAAALTAASNAETNAANAVTLATAAVSTADEAVSTASAAEESAATAVSTAEEAVTTANAAASDAATAASTAETAASDAATAVSTAEEAVTTANTAASDAAAAVETANTAASDAAAAVETANTAASDAATAVSTAETAYTTAAATVLAIAAINGIIYAVPSQAGTLTYTGEAQSPTWYNYDTTLLTIGGTLSATDAGSYTATFTPNDGYYWEDKTSDAKSVTWTINNATISTVPSQSGSLTYSGSAQSPSWSNYSTTQLTIGGTTSATAAGSYTATFTPTSNYMWSDGTTTAKSVTWTISKATISTTPSQSGSLTYSGSAQSPSWSNYSSTQLTIGGTTSATAAGSYTATFTPTSNYMWSDSSTTAKSVTWTIGKATISTTPSQSGTLTYSGSAQSPSWSNYSSTQLTIGGTTSATAAGSYTATFTPTSNYMWSDSTTTAKSVTWTISKATGSLSLSSTAVTLSATVTSATVTVTRSGDGTISASSSSTSVATVSVSGTTVTITGVAAGSATITVSVAAGTNYTAPSSKTISVTSTIPSTTLNSNDWSVISAASDAGVGSSYWSVGDRKAVAVSGTVGYLSMSGTYYCYILGFNHNSTYEGSSRIHFQFGFTAASSGTHIAFIDGRYGARSTSTSGFKMAGPSYTGYSTGWSGSYMRNVICPAFESALPSELTAVLKTVTKYTCKSYLTRSSIGSTTDTIFIPAEYEVTGSNVSASSYECSYQKQYTYYSNGNSKVMYRHSSTSSTCIWWLRSLAWTYYEDEDEDTGTIATGYECNGYCSITTSGSSYTNYRSSGYSYGFAPCFCV